MVDGLVDLVIKCLKSMAGRLESPQYKTPSKTRISPKYVIIANNGKRDGP
jgi:hypothetical protein